ncbi:MAG TPA: Sec-independent protein translocase protein TatB [Lysobacter sp.]|nr:Sec-independent protein translocase protein TatB [Lysobacter sp.]
MFDLGFSELLLIALVALVVLGPQRLPKAARFAGLWVRRARAQWHSVKSEFEREIADEELRRSLHDTRAQFDQAAERLRGDLTETERAWREQADELRRVAAPDADDTSGPRDAVREGAPAALAVASTVPSADTPVDPAEETLEAWDPDDEVPMDRPSISSEPPDDWDTEPAPDAMPDEAAASIDAPATDAPAQGELPIDAPPAPDAAQAVTPRADADDDDARR